MIRADSIRKRFGGHEVLRGTSFNVTAGERVALLGLNGAGKTTLMRCLLGLIRFDGELEIAGYDLKRDGRSARMHLGYVPQRAPHFEGTLAENVEFFAHLRGVPSRTVRERLGELGLSLDLHGEKPVNTLSGGMLQKALLALALASESKLLLLDEPTANLDPRARHDFIKALKTVDASTTILLASHRLADVEAIAERLLVLYDGRIAYDGSVVDLWKQAGTITRLWVKFPANSRDAAYSHLLATLGGAPILANGAAIGVSVELGARSDVIVGLRQAGFEIDDFWTDAPSLNDLLERILTSPAQAESP